MLEKFQKARLYELLTEISEQKENIIVFHINSLPRAYIPTGPFTFLEPRNRRIL